MKIVKKVITVFVTIILLLVLSFNLFNFISIKLLGNNLPTINGYAYLEVISGSMEPKIKKGDIVIIDTKVSDYKVNDIVTFKDINGSFVTHRIIEINENEIITKGDANNTIDDAIDKSDIVGRYVYQIDGIGALIKSLRSPFILVMILVIGVLLCVFVSTDSKGNAILTEEEKEYMEFLANKNNKSSDKVKKDKTVVSKKTSAKNASKTVDNKQNSKVSKTETKSEDKKAPKSTGKTTKNIKTTKNDNSKENTKSVKSTSKNKTGTQKTTKPTSKTNKTVKSTKVASSKDNSKVVKSTTKAKVENAKSVKSTGKNSRTTKTVKTNKITSKK